MRLLGLLLAAVAQTVGLPIPPPLQLTADWVIVYPAEPNCFEVRAAEILRSEVALATNLTLSLLAEGHDKLPGGAQPHRIYVGHTLALQATGRLTARPLGAEETWYFVEDGHLFIAGDDAGTPLRGNQTHALTACRSRYGNLPSCVGSMPTYSTCRAGTLYAAYRFVREVLSVRFVWPGEDGTVRVTGQKITFPKDLDTRSAPAIALRQVRPNPLEQTLEVSPATLKELANDLPGMADAKTLEEIRFAEHEWYMQLGLGSHGTTPWGQAFMDWWSIYNISHREYFALQPNGQRGPDTKDWGAGKSQWTKMCVSQPALWRQIVGNFADHQHPEGSGNHSLGVSACEDDMDGGYCTCDKCRAWDANVNSSSGRLSDRYARFWNEVYAEMNRTGHGDKWVSGYAYASYTDPPTRTHLNGNILILSVGFGDYPALPNETAFQRRGWGGWADAGAKAMALRPNSLWNGDSTAPFVISTQLVEDLIFTGQHGLMATDFDSNVANYQAVGPTYYCLARALWDPAHANLTALQDEYYSAYAGAASEMRSFWQYWEDWTSTTFTAPTVRARLAELMASPDTGNGRAHFIMIPDIYTDAAIAPAEAWLGRAKVTCGAAADDACGRVGKAGLYLDYLRVLRAAVNATNLARAASKEDPRAGWWTQTIDAAAMVTEGRALRAMGMRIRGQMIVNVLYTFAKATERGDLFGLAAAYDAPAAWQPGSQGGGLGLHLLPTQHWALRFDPQDIGNRGPVSDRWWNAGVNRSDWTQLRGPATRPWSDIPEMQHPRASQSHGSHYAGVGWYAAAITIRSAALAQGRYDTSPVSQHHGTPAAACSTSYYLYCAV